MERTNTISIDRLRRRKRAEQSAAVEQAHPLIGATLGVLQRRYGLMSSEETIVIADVVATSGDLAVADRLAFVAAMERHVGVAVIEFEGGYVACTTERALVSDDLAALRPVDCGPRMMSLVTDRGITPALGPLVA